MTIRTDTTGRTGDDQKRACRRWKYDKVPSRATSLLIHMGFTVLAIAERMGHEAEKITLKYAHLFPTVQTEMAEKLDMERMKKEDE